MIPTFAALCFDAQDPTAVGRFWAAVLQRDLAVDPIGGTVLVPAKPAEFPIRFRPTSTAKTVANRFHFDLASESLEHQQATVARALARGAEHIDVGQLPEDGHVVLADPEGNEFCVIEPGNNFLTDTGAIGALAGDGTRQVGQFWATALDWPLVWDENEETAIQSPRGGTKITWGGPPVEPKVGVARLRFELALAPDLLAAGLARLVEMGARQLDPRETGLRDAVDAEVLADPDGNEFSLRSS